MVYSAFRLQSIITESQDWNWRQELKQRQQRKAAHGLAPHGLLTLLLYATQATATLGWAFPHQSLINKTLHGIPQKQI